MLRTGWLLDERFAWKRLQAWMAANEECVRRSRAGFSRQKTLCLAGAVRCAVGMGAGIDSQACCFQVSPGLGGCSGEFKRSAEVHERGY